MEPSDALSISDPLDDGYTEGDVFPKGAWRPPNGIQRGSVTDIRAIR